MRSFGDRQPTLGGILDDWATGVALDASGNVLVTRQTRSPNFPLANPIESVYNNAQRLERC
jgi:hypothetical protein